MITINTLPPALVKVDNPVLIYAATNNLYDTFGSKAQLIISLGTEPIAGDTISFSAMGRSFLFTFATSPNDSGMQLPTRPGGFTDIQYLNHLVFYLSKNYYLYTNYDISIVTFLGVSAIRVLAKNTGTFYNFFAIVSGTLTIGALAGMDTKKQSSFAIIAQVWLLNPNDGVFKMVGEEAIRPDNDGKARFNFSEYLKPHFITKITLVSPTLHQVHTDLYRPFFVKYGEFYGTPPSAKAMETVGNFFAIPGKLRDFDFEEKYRNNTGAWTTYRMIFNTTRKFLTNQPNPKTTRRYSDERLYWAHQGSFKKVFKIYYNDGTTYQVKTTVTSTQTGLWEILTDIRRNLLDNFNLSKTIVKYDFYLMNVDETEQLSETFTYLVDQKKYLHEREFLFRNRDGGYDSIRFTGEQMAEQTSERILVTEGPAVENPFIHRKKKDVVDYNEEAVEQNSGYIFREQVDWAMEILESEDVYERTSDGYLPVNITSESITKYSEKQKQYAFSFEYTRCLSQMIQKPIITLYDDFITQQAIWGTLYENNVPGNPDFAWVGGSYVQYNSITTTTGKLAYIGPRFTVPGQIYEVEIDVESTTNYSWIVQLSMNGLTSERMTVFNERKKFKVKFIAQDSTDLELYVFFRASLITVPTNNIKLHSITVSQCLE